MNETFTNEYEKEMGDSRTIGSDKVTNGTNDLQIIKLFQGSR